MKLKPIYTALKRYHRSKGYGIHSPFAFNFTVKVLHERGQFYAYDDIRQWRSEAIALARESVRHPRVISLKHAKLLLRVTCHFAPRAILQIGSTYGVSALSVLRADSRATLVLYPGESHRHDVFTALNDRYPHSVVIADSLDDAIARHDRIVGSQPPFVIVNDIDCGATAGVIDVMTRALEAGGTVITRNITRSERVAEAWATVNGALSHGMTFTNGSMGIIVGQHHLPRQTFSLWF